MKDVRMAIESALNSLNLTRITLDMSRESLIMGHGIEGDVARDRIVELTLADQVECLDRTIEGLQKTYNEMGAKAEEGGN